MTAVGPASATEPRTGPDDTVVIVAPPRRPRRRPGLPAVTTVVAAVVALPVLVLLVDATRIGPGPVGTAIGRAAVLRAALGTLSALAVVVPASLAIGTAAAWLVERSDLPARRAWAVLLVVPVAVPRFVTAFGWVSLSGQVRGLPGAAVVMTAAGYPLVYIPVAVALRRADPAGEELARSLGAGAVRTLRSITLGGIRPALLVGAAAVAAATIGDDGGFRVLHDRTLTTAVDASDGTGAAAVALLVAALAVGLVVVALLGLLARRLPATPPAAVVAPTHEPVRLGRARPVAVAAVSLLVTVALGVPVAEVLARWSGGARRPVPGAGLAAAGLHSAAVAAAAAVVATLLALPAAAALRRGGRCRRMLAAAIVLAVAGSAAVPAGSVVALAAGDRDPGSVTTLPVLAGLSALVVFPVALVAVRAALRAVPDGAGELAASLGRSRLVVWRRVTVGPVLPGLRRAVVVVAAVVAGDLTVAPLLAPAGAGTLPVRFWAAESSGATSPAAAAALVLLAVTLPVGLLVAGRVARSGRPSERSGRP